MPTTAQYASPVGDAVGSTLSVGGALEDEEESVGGSVAPMSVGGPLVSVGGFSMLTSVGESDGDGVWGDALGLALGLREGAVGLGVGDGVGLCVVQLQPAHV